MFWSSLNDFERDDWLASAADNMRRLHEEMTRLLDDSAGGEYPPVQIWSDEERAVVAAEVPGVRPDELDVSVMGNVLTLSGERRAEELGAGSRFLRRERGAGRFTRTVELPYHVDSSKVQAEYKFGLLTVMLPRAEENKPRKITIK